MRTTIIILFTCVFISVAETGHSQNARVSLNKNNVNLKEVLNEIENQTDYLFIYNNEVNTNKTVSVNSKNRTVREVLNHVLKNSNIGFSMEGNHIILSYIEKQLNEKNEENIETAQQQGKTITGKVVDAQGETIIGANIIEKGTSNGTITDFDGKFTLQVSEDAVLRISYIGYLEQEVDTQGKNSFNIVLQEDTKTLDELVVIGYGAMKKSDLTGAVSSIRAEDLNPGANASLEQALQGRVAGIQISQKSNEPGGGQSVNIRGAGSIQAGNEPLYVIDGLIVNGGTVAGTGGAGFTSSQNPRNPLNSLNPSDIESVEVLKDASATAIYGSRGSNGVILITTKKGKKGKLRIGFDSYYGIQKPAKTLDVLNPTQYYDVINSIIDLGGGDLTQKIYEIEENGTNWQDHIYREAATQSHNISFSGGSDNLTYYSSINYFDQKGLLKGSGMERYSARINLSYNEDQKIRAGASINGAYINDEFAAEGAGVNENGGVIYTAINYDPVLTAYNEDGSYRRSQFFTGDNPLSILNGQSASAKTLRMRGDTYLEYFIIPEVSAKVMLGADIQDVRRDVFVDPNTLSGAGTGGIATIQTGRKDYVSFEGTLNFNKDFGANNLNGVLGTTYEYFQTESFGANARGYALPDLGTSALGSGDPELSRVNSGRTQAKFISYIARANYSLKNKYLLTGSLRIDGSSRFGENNRFGFFPSGAIAWKMQEEDFIKDISWINELKPRISIGSVGNANIGNSLPFQTFSTGGQMLFGNDYHSSITPSRIANPNLTWEKAIQYDLGFDYGFFDNRVVGSLDYFIKETTNLLITVPQPLNTGFAGQIQNLGGIRNQGLELSVDWDVIRDNDLYWNLTGNIATLRNKVTNIGNRGDIIRGEFAQIPGFSIITPGQPLESYYGYIVDGVWQESDNFSATNDNVKPGDVKFRDLNGDRIINGSDRAIIGNPIPDFTWGLNSSLRFKDFTLDVFMQGVHGIEKLNANLANSMFPNNFRQNRIAEPLLNRWTPDNPTNKYPSFVNPLASGGSSALINTLTVEDASYIRLQSVRLGYDIPVKALRGVNNLSLYFSLQNLFTITNYSGTDPAANASGSNTSAVDFNAYPLPRTYLIGINVEF